MNDMSDFDETSGFSRIEALKPGWMEGDGEVPDERTISEAKRICAFLRDVGVRYCVFPTLDGGISIEDVADDDLSFSITLDPDGGVLLFADGEEDEEEHERSEDLPNGSDWMSSLRSRN